MTLLSQATALRQMIAATHSLVTAAPRAPRAPRAMGLPHLHAPAPAPAHARRTTAAQNAPHRTRKTHRTHPKNQAHPRQNHSTSRWKLNNSVGCAPGFFWVRSVRLAGPVGCVLCGSGAPCVSRCGCRCGKPCARGAIYSWFCIHACTVACFEMLC